MNRLLSLGSAALLLASLVVMMIYAYPSQPVRRPVMGRFHFLDDPADEEDIARSLLESREVGTGNSSTTTSSPTTQAEYCPQWFKDTMVRNATVQLIETRGVFPPPYMVSRYNLFDTCHKEADYYYGEHCKDCATCCRDFYLHTCLRKFIRSDPVKYALWPEKVPDAKCDDVNCKPYFSYVLAASRCMRQMGECGFYFETKDDWSVRFYIRRNCELHWYKSICMARWNDKSLYKLPGEYLEDSRNVYRAGVNPIFIKERCDSTLDTTLELAPKLKVNWTIEMNCTIVPQSKSSGD